MQTINLVLVIGHLIEERRPDLAASWLMSVQGCGDLPIHQQIVVVNRYWREQLGILNKDTVHLRQLLNDSVESNAWFDNFKQYIIPFIIDNNLPNTSLFKKQG